MVKKSNKIKKQNKNKSQKKSVSKKEIYEPYAIHKATLISFDPKASCDMLKKIFGNLVTKCIDPPDPALKKRGLKWINFKTGGKAEFHFVPPYTLKDDKLLRRLAKQEKTQHPLESQFYENHIGIYIPDLTDVIIKILKMKVPCHLNRRSDGMYQFYFPIEGCLDYLDVDSLKIDFEKIKKIDPNFRAFSFHENLNLINKYEQRFTKKLKNRETKTTRLYTDPEHNNAPRKVTFHDGETVFITGKDTKKGKKWRVKGKINKNKSNMIIDFSSKGGPKNISAKILKNGIKFKDGNMWNLVYKLR